MARRSTVWVQGQALRSQEAIDLLDRLTDLDTLTDADRAALLHILDSLIANTHIRAALHNAG